jgi:hypothetical protein
MWEHDSEDPEMHDAAKSRIFSIFDKTLKMGAIVIKSDNSKHLKLLAEIAEQLGETVSKLSAAEVEDLQLGLIIEREKTGKSVSRKTIFKHLDS